MGKGDRRTRRGKIFAGSFGKTRLQKKREKLLIQKKQQAKLEAAPKAVPKAAPKAASAKSTSKTTTKTAGKATTKKEKVSSDENE